MQVREAVAQIDEIWSHVARTERFRGYRPLTIAATGVLGLVAAIIQSRVCADPIADTCSYLNLWVSVAITNILVVSLELSSGYINCASPLDRQLTRRAVLQFFPCLAGGAMITWLLPAADPNFVCLLPGLWTVCYSLGLFGSLPYTAPAVSWVAVFYLIAGGIQLSCCGSNTALHPWMMGCTFGIGQLLLANTLRNSERQQRATE